MLLYDCHPGCRAGAGHRHRKKVRYQAIQLLRVTHPHFRLRRVGGLFGFGRQAFYQHKSRQMTGEERDEQVLSLVEQTRADHPRIGGKKLYDLIREELMTKG